MGFNATVACAPYQEYEVLKKELFSEAGQKYIFAKFIVSSPLKLFPINYIFGGDIKFNGLINESVDDNNKKFKEQYMLSNTNDIFVSIDTAYIRDTLNEILRTLQSKGV